MQCSIAGVANDCNGKVLNQYHFVITFIKMFFLVGLTDLLIL